MGISPLDGDQMTMWDYEALVVTWNRRHNEAANEAPPATKEQFENTMIYFSDNPHLLQ